MGVDNQQSQKDIVGKIQGLLTFLDLGEKSKQQENLDAWQDLFESLRDIGNNPIPFLLELIKQLKANGKQPDIKNRSKNYFSQAKKSRSGKGDTDDATNRKPHKKRFLQKYHLDTSQNDWGRIINQIIKNSIVKVIPRVKDILFEEIIKAFNCDLSTEVPVVGDGLSGPIIIRIDQIDIFRQLKLTPDVDVGKFAYERDQLNPTAPNYPPGQSKFPLNRFLWTLINNNGVFQSPGASQTIYGASGKALFDITFVGPDLLEIYPYYSQQSGNPDYQSAPGNPAGSTPAGTPPAAPGPPPFGPGVPTDIKFTFIEFLKDYFDNIDLFELHNMLGALLEILWGFMSVKNKAINLDDIKAIERLLTSIEKMLDACEGADLNQVSTESVSHLAELYDDDSFFSFDLEEERNIELEAIRKSKGVIKLKSCGEVEIPFDPTVIDDGIDAILSELVPQEQRKQFDLLLQRAVPASAVAGGIQLSLGEINVPVGLDFKENIIKNLPKILMYSVLNPKGTLPIVLVSKLLNENIVLSSSADLWAKIFKRVLIRVVGEISREIANYLLGILRGILLQIIQKKIKMLLEERFKKQYLIIKALLDLLLPLLEALQNCNSCKCIFDAILNILKTKLPLLTLGNIPPPLKAAAIARPGTSALGGFERLIGKLQKQGVDTSDLPNGAPNTFLLTQFAMMQSIDEEAAENGKIESIILNGQVITPVGPGQIMPFTQAFGIPR